MRVTLPRYSYERVDGPTRHYRTPQGVFPSVTAILSATKDVAGLEAWRKRIGAEEAERIRTDACARGEWLHGCIERYLEWGELPTYHWVWQGWWNSAHQWISNHVGQPLVLEAPVYSPLGFSGTLDAICEVDGEVVLCDWKNALRPKKPQHLEDYMCQLAAYRRAAHHVYQEQGLRIDTAYCVIALNLEEAQVVRLDAAELMLQEIRFMERLDEYNQKKAASSHG
jgi:genome maintenance exonuclease 1